MDAIADHGVIGALTVLLTTGGNDMEMLLKSQCTVKMMEELNDWEEQVRHNHIAYYYSTFAFARCL